MNANSTTQSNPQATETAAEAIHNLAPATVSPNHSAIRDQQPGIPPHILDFCNRVYPPHLGSAYDAQRAHLIAKRMLIESASSSMPSTESILSALKNKNTPLPPIPKVPLLNEPQQSHDHHATQPQQPRDDGATEPQQRRDTPATEPQQQPQQNTQTTANPSSSMPQSEIQNPQSKHAGHKSIIDSLPSQTQQAIAHLLTQESLNRVVFILSKPGPHGPALDISRDVLHRYRHRLLREQTRARAAEARTFVDKLREDPHASEADLAAAIRHIFQLRLLDDVIDPALSLDQLLKALETSERFRKNDLAARRLSPGVASPAGKT